MPKKQSWFNVKAADANAPGEVAGEVSIRGFIGEWGVTDRDFIASVEALGDVDTINVRINSRGGEVDHAFSIFNYLKAHKATVNVRVDGVAMSSGSIIAMAGDHIEMPANTLMMVHNPWTFASGSAADLRKEADNLDAFESALRATYMARTGKTEDEIKALLDDETYMTAAEAVELGFADVVLPIGKQQAAAAVAYADALGIPPDVLAKIEAAEAAADAAAEAAEAEENTKEDDTDNATDAPAAQAETLAAFVHAAARDFGLQDYAADIALDAAVQDTAAAHAALTVAKEIKDLCDVAQKPAMAAALIRRRVTLDEARTALINARASEDEATHTDSHLPGNGSTQAAPNTPAQAEAVRTSTIWSNRRANQRF